MSHIELTFQVRFPRLARALIRIGLALQLLGARRLGRRVAAHGMRRVEIGGPPRRPRHPRVTSTNRRNP
jgi:hypothetical protein